MMEVNVTRSSFSPLPYSNAYAAAAAYLAAGRNGSQRTIGNNTVLRRIYGGAGNGDIAVRLHNTDVVTYHLDGTMTIYGGGWNTVTTKDRISGYSPCRPGSDGHGNWVVGYTDQVTPAKVQKCRMCLKTGPEWMRDIVCDPNRYWWGGTSSAPHPYMCKGGTEEHAVPYTGHDSWDAHYASRYTKPCEHGELTRHQHTACEHGIMGAHVTGVSAESCHQCKGTGRFDYGSKRVPILVTANDHFKIDATGKVIATEAHPATGDLLPVMEIIRDLFDGHNWTREQIAQWVATRRHVTV